MLNEAPLPQRGIYEMFRFAQHDNEIQGNFITEYFLTLWLFVWF